ncbi:MAG: hypothetical protein ABW067_14645 [Rhizobacter sp.]
MNSIDTPRAAPLPDAERPPALAPGAADRVDHLFRLSLRAGLVHPLYQTVRAYRTPRTPT